MNNEKVVLYVFLAITLASSKTVFSQTVVQGLKVYEGNISNMEVFFPNLKRAEIKTPLVLQTGFTCRIIMFIRLPAFILQSMENICIFS